MTMIAGSNHSGLEPVLKSTHFKQVLTQSDNFLLAHRNKTDFSVLVFSVYYFAALSASSESLTFLFRFFV